MAILLTENCIGCGACKEACLPGSVELRRGSDGFMRAYISEDGCTACGRCKIVCPQLRSSRMKPLEVLAYQNPDKKVLMRSQSGGAFVALAQEVLQDGGSVFGVRWTPDCSNAEFAEATSPEEIQSFSGSKYIPADLSAILPSLKISVKSGRLTLFSGLPCQVAAVRNLLPHRDNLLLVEVLCMGPMSPAVWHHLRLKMPAEMKTFLFRDKRRRGWGYPDASYELSNGDLHIFGSRRYAPCQLFSRGTTMSASCLRCKFKSIERVADITMGDFWGIEQWVDLPEEIRRQGISIVHAQTEIGRKYLTRLENGVLGKFTKFENLAKVNGGYGPLSSDVNRRQKTFTRWSHRIGLRGTVTLASLMEKLGRHFP